jgi:hypothetical protein
MMKIGAGVVVTVAALWSQATDPAAVRDRLDAYLAVYEPELSTLVATEQMTQVIQGDPRPSTGGRLATPPPAIRKTLASEVAFVALPGEGGWLGVRVVRKVNGRPVKSEAAAFTELLQSGDPLTVARRLLAASAEHNLGMSRNSNLPNLPLELLHPRHRNHFTYEVSGTDRVGGEAVTKLVAREAKTPALIHGPNGEPLESRVTAWIDSAGRLWRAEARSRYAEISGRQDEPVVRVDFRYDRTLDLLVPFEMRERFTTGTPGLMGTSTAKYTDFRRFQTSARIVPQH